MGIHPVHTVNEFLNALADADPSDTIQVYPGDYYFTSRLLINKDLYIEGIPPVNFYFDFADLITEGDPPVTRLLSYFKYASTVTGGELSGINFKVKGAPFPGYQHEGIIFCELIGTTDSPSNLTLKNLSLSSISGYANITGLKGSMKGTNTIERINITKLAGIGIHLYGFGLGDSSSLKNISITDLGTSGVPSHGVDITSARNCLFQDITVNNIQDNTTEGFGGIYLRNAVSDIFYGNIIRNITVKNVINQNTTSLFPTSGIIFSGTYIRNNNLFNLIIDNIQTASENGYGSYGIGLNVSDGAHHNRLENLTISNTKTWDIWTGESTFKGKNNLFCRPFTLNKNKLSIATEEGNYMALPFGDKVLKYDSSVGSPQYIYAETLTTDGFLTLTVHSDNNGERGMGWILLDGAQVAYSSTHWWSGGDEHIRANSCTAPVKAGTYVTVYAQPSWGSPRYTIWWFPVV